MAIDAYVGLMGHGKSHGVVEHVIIPSLKQDRLVVTNIPLESDALLMDFGGNIQQLPEDWWAVPDIAVFVPNGAVLVLDELWQRWPSGLRQDQLAISDGELLMKHRHKVDKQGNSMRIVLVTQDLGQIASCVRELVETTYRMYRLSKTKFRVDIFRGPVKGNKPPQKDLIRQTFGSYRESVWRYYKSATQSDTGSVGDESKADKRGSIFRSFKLWGIIIGFFVFMLVALFLAFNLLGKKDKLAHSNIPVKESIKPVNQAVEVKTPTKQVAPKAPAPVPTKVEAPKIISSDFWRIAGELKNKRNHLVLLISSTNVPRQILFKSHCKYIDDALSISCMVDGQLVTYWSGGYQKQQEELSVVGSLTK